MAIKGAILQGPFPFRNTQTGKGRAFGPLSYVAVGARCSVQCYNNVINTLGRADESVPLQYPQIHFTDLKAVNKCNNISP